MVSRSSRRPRTRWIAGLGRFAGREMLYTSAVALAAIVLGGILAVAGAGGAGRSSAGVGVGLILVAPFVPLPILAYRLRQRAPGLALMLAATILISLSGLVIALLGEP